MFSKNDNYYQIMLFSKKSATNRITRYSVYSQVVSHRSGRSTILIPSDFVCYCVHSGLHLLFTSDHYLVKNDYSNHYIFTLADDFECVVLTKV